MSRLTERQSAIIGFLRNCTEETSKKSDILNQFSHWYYCNSDKHLSEILHRMVKSGLLVKPKHGFYKIGDGKKKNQEEKIENQTELF